MTGTTRKKGQHIPGLGAQAEYSRSRLAEAHRAREEGLRLSRDLIRRSSESIRAMHREDFDLAEQLLTEAGDMARGLTGALEDHPAVRHAGFADDGLKEYAEAAISLAFARGDSLPTQQQLGVGPATYLGGLAEAASEMRRRILDLLRRDDIEGCERLLGLMDEVYGVLITVDYPDGLTRGLRSRTDALRAVLERTRGDLTVAVRQGRLERRMASLESVVRRPAED